MVCIMKLHVFHYAVVWSGHDNTFLISDILFFWCLLMGFRPKHVPYLCLLAKCVVALPLWIFTRICVSADFFQSFVIHWTVVKKLVWSLKEAQGTKSHHGRTERSCWLLIPVSFYPSPIIMAWNLGAISHGLFLFDYMELLEEMDGLNFQC